MTIKKDRTGLVSLISLSSIEKRIFVKFLKFERRRHEEDIENIDETIAKLEVRQK